jgi:hypothetical protein
LRELGLWLDSHTTPAKLAFAGLLLAPVMQLVMSDNATSSAEFEAVEKYVGRIQREFELATRSDLESVGTDMGLLPMLKGTWDTPKFFSARAMLADALGRLKESEAHEVRNEISRAALAVAHAGSPHLISLHMVDEEERKLIHEIARDLQLERSSEGLNLLGKSGDE